ncbi:MAG: major facilitator superfamily 1 [Phycisphaerales bacterium]|nr:major facilitator superfamily 1 [Phycisphaerales bacterium]
MTRVQPLITAPAPDATAGPWYAGVTRYQWLVLVIASAGWVFDAFEGQLFNLTRQDLLRDLLSAADAHRQKFWGDFFLAAFLVGGTLGGIAFGTLADRFGRKPAMVASILFYSVFSGLTYFATQLWHVAALRFLVALGVGGEWAVAASLVAEVFPTRARARAGGIFHATSVMGTWLATGAALIVGSQWRYAYLVGVVPALLVLWVRSSVHEPERWQQATLEGRQLGSFRELFGVARWARRAIFGLLLAAVGLSTFWCVVVASQDLTRELLLRNGASPADAARHAKFAYGIVQAIGMGIGFLCVGPLAERLGRRGAFLLMHLCAAAIVPVTCYLPQTYWQMLILLPIFGFFTGGIHAGYAVYFPELFPNHLRATGAGVCFNGGRLVAAPLLWVSGELKSTVDLRLAVTLLASLFLVGAFVLIFLPETKGKPLPE